MPMKLREELEQTLLERAKEGDMSALKTLLKYQSEVNKKDEHIDIGKFTIEERLELKKFVENAIKEIRAKLDEKKHAEAH